MTARRRVARADDRRLLRAAVRGADRGRRPAARRAARRDRSSPTTTTSTSSTASSSRVNNWDAHDAAVQVRRLGEARRSRRGPRQPDAQRFTLFEPCGKEVEVQHRLRRRAARPCSPAPSRRWSRRFPASGAPTLTVRGLNVLHQLRRKQYTRRLGAASKDSEIAENIGDARATRRRSNKRFPLPIEIDPDGAGQGADAALRRAEEPVRHRLPVQRARERGYVVFVLEGRRQAATRPRRLVLRPVAWRPGRRLRDVIYRARVGARR